MTEAKPAQNCGACGLTLLAVALALVLPALTGCVTSEIRDSALMLQQDLRVYTAEAAGLAAVSSWTEGEKAAFTEAGEEIVAHVDELERATR